jgi:hypothetical protein
MGEQLAYQVFVIASCHVEFYLTTKVIDDFGPRLRFARVDSPDDVAWDPGRRRWSRIHVERVLWIPSFFAVYAIIMETVTSADQEKIYLIWEAV